MKRHHRAWEIKWALKMFTVQFCLSVKPKTINWQQNVMSVRHEGKISSQPDIESKKHLLFTEASTEMDKGRRVAVRQLLFKKAVWRTIPEHYLTHRLKEFRLCWRVKVVTQNIDFQAQTVFAFYSAFPCLHISISWQDIIKWGVNFFVHAYASNRKTSSIYI